MSRYRKRVAPGIASFAETPLARVLGTLSGRWSVLALEAMHDGARHFNELQRRLDGISHKVLVDTLRALQREGFVYGPLTSPGLAEYGLTLLGVDLVALIDGIRGWSEDHRLDLVDARDCFEEARAAG